ncbi:MAG TPA: glycosyltransferase family 4 protein [Novosphingobium sp.]|nr:glycosyltransferase family 4 protein [Novosphingobium sp.]
MTLHQPIALPRAPAEDGAAIFAFSLRRDSTPARRVALIGGFAPRKCGIATFTTDVFEQLSAHQRHVAVDVWALRDPGGPDPDARVRATIRSDDRDGFLAAARAINAEGYDAVWLQHEYGIFGGECGALVLDFAEAVAAPLIVTLHTVLTEPSPAERAILERLVALAAQVMVMSRHARDLLIERYAVDSARVTVIEHGAPERPYGRREAFKERFGWGERKVLMTFGLLGPGKGIETMIAALPAIVARHPDVLYRIVGATHPNLVASQGESYRERLEALAAELGVTANVAFDNRFLDTEELLDQIEACDIYVTPYFNLQQSTSGTLSFAVALGKAVVSTPYVHAGELLADGVGTLVEPRSPEALSDAVLGLLDDPARLEEQSRAAYERGRATTWPRFAEAGAALIESVAVHAPALLPSPSDTPALTAVEAMSDATGMLQHAIGIVADRRHGYCLDDNVRALILMLRAEAHPRAQREALATRYAAFVQHAWNPDRGAFRNFMNFDRTWCEEVGSDDSNGRTVWALGLTVEHGFDGDWRAWGRRWFDIALPAMAGIESPRAIAFAMLGCAAALRSGSDNDKARDYLEVGAAVLHSLLAAARRPDWAWFEAVLGYDNPRLSQALIEAGELLGRAEWRREGLESLAWIARQQVSASGHFRPVGSEGFGREYLALPFDQQPLEAWAAIDAAAAAHAATGEASWRDHALTAYRWYFGANDRGAVLADLATGRCRDGVTPRGFNENCGAESILAFQLAHYSIAALLRQAHHTGAGTRIGLGALASAGLANSR